MHSLLRILDWLFLLTIANTFLFCLAGISTLKIPPHPKALGARVFYYSTYLSQAHLFAIIISIFTSVVICFTHDPAVLIITSACINFLLLMLSFANSIVYYKYRFGLNMDILRLVFAKGGSQVVQIHPLEYLIFFCAFVFVLAITFGLQLLAWQWSSYAAVAVTSQYLCILFLTLYVLNQATYIIFCIKKQMPIMQYVTKIYLYDKLSLCRLLKYCGMVKDELYQVLNHNSQMHYPLQPLKNTSNNQLNVILIVVDSLRFDVVTSKIMPNLHSISKDFTTFNNHYSGGNTTQPGIFSLFYGIPPTYWKQTQKQHLAPAMITKMQQHHYQFGIFASATLENPPFHNNVFCSIEGLQTFTEGKSPLERDKQITDSMLRFIQERDTEKPFFGFLFYDSPHGYYAIPDLPKHFQPVKHINHITVNNESDSTPLKNLYLCAVHEVDKLVGKVIRTIQDLQLLENTIVMITGDHGQEFNDLKKNYWEHPSNFARFQTKVPMIVLHPNQPHKQYSHFTAHYDVVPMIMQDALGIINPTYDYTVGQHLYQEKSELFHIMANYTNYALMESHSIAEIQKSGCYRMVDHDMNYQDDPQLDASVIANILECTQRFYTDKITEIPNIFKDEALLK